jgi:hypothetical protein
LIEARCQYRGEGGKRASVRYPSSPCGWGTAPSFYRPRRGGLQSCPIVLAMYGGMVCSATEWMVVLTNLASGRRRGESCACPGAISRAVVWEPLVWPFCMRQLMGWADRGLEVTQRWAWRRLVVLGSHSTGDGAAVLGMVAQRRGWPHRADGDKGDMPHWSDVSASSRASARQTFVPFSRVSLFSFEGAACRSYGSRRHSVTELTLVSPHSSSTVLGITSLGELAKQRRDTISRRCQRASMAGIRP